MSQLSLAHAKTHVAISAGFTDHDTLIQSFIDAAELWVVGRLCRDLNAEYPDGWPEDILQVVRMQTAHYYAHREAITDGVSFAEMPLAVKELLPYHRSFAG